jgi:hypothetical protein
MPMPLPRDADGQPRFRHRIHRRRRAILIKFARELRGGIHVGGQDRTSGTSKTSSKVSPQVWTSIMKACKIIECRDSLMFPGCVAAAFWAGDDKL